MKKYTASYLVVALGLIAGTLPAAARAQVVPATTAEADKPLPPVTLDLQDAPLKQALTQLFQNAKAQSMLDPAIGGFVTLNIRDQPFENALKLLLRSANPPLTYTKENGVYIVKPRLDPTANQSGFPGGGTSPDITADTMPATSSKLDKITLTYVDAADIASNHACCTIIFLK